MLEKLYHYTIANSKTIEKIVEDDHVGIAHVVLGHGESLQEHDTKSNLYMTVIRGAITLQLEEQEEHDYPAGSIISIPYKTKMNVGNKHLDVVEIFIVQAPSPKMLNNS